MTASWLSKQSMRFFYRISLFFAWCYFRVFYRLRVLGLEHYFYGKGILASNHASYLDPPLISISSPEEIHFVAKEELFHSFFGMLIKRLNAHPIARGETNLKIMKELVQLIEKQKKILIFPEGSRSHENQIASLKTGIVILVEKTQCDVLPVYLDGTFEVWNRKRKMPKLFGRMTCVFGSPIKWQDIQDLEPKKEKSNSFLDSIILSVS